MHEKLRAFSEAEAEAHLVDIKSPGKSRIGDSSESMPLRASHDLLIARQAKEDLARKILETRPEDLIKAIEAGDVRGLLHLCAVRVDSCAVTRIHYWCKLGQKEKPAPAPEPVPEGYRKHFSVLLKVGPWEPYAEEAEQVVCDIKTKDGRTYDECWPDADRGGFKSLVEDGLFVAEAEVAEIRYLTFPKEGEAV